MPKLFSYPLSSLQRALLETDAVAGAPAQESSGSAPSKQELFERRTELRYPSQDPAEIELIGRSTEPIYATILDVSRSGLRVALPTRIGRGERIKLKLRHNVIFGEIRYCHAVSGSFQAGIRIHELAQPSKGVARQHIDDDGLSLYVIGKGLDVSEVIKIRDHLGRCEACRARLSEKSSVLNASKKVRPLL